ncbi:hypothetical protein GIB67_010279 [Kingdonia uniflora]|uniref:Piwi domain-containing protein n=1 Tax=Kingdonia uniflora TaxID=39325 RepID=A0A7J7M9P9_9MAGN|nr:hypothetical protein GIB67_010279 [Kingdonia uniflora]
MGSCDTSPSLVLLFGVFNLLLGPLHLVEERLFHTGHSKRWFLAVFTWAFQTYHTESGRHNFLYDVEKSLYTLEGFPQNKHEFTVVLDDITSTTSNRTTANGSSGTGVGSPDVRHQFQPEMKLVKPTRVNDQYLTNILQNINGNLGGLNSMLTTEHGLNIPVIPKAPAMMLGMDVSHDSPGQADAPSIYAVIYL